MTVKIYSLLSDSDKFTTVEENVVIEGPDGPRQFDVVVRSVREGITNLRGDPMLYIGGKTMDVAFDNALHSGMIPLDPLNEKQLWVPVESEANYVRTEYNHYRSIESL